MKTEEKNRKFKAICIAISQHGEHLAELENPFLYNNNISSSFILTQLQQRCGYLNPENSMNDLRAWIHERRKEIAPVVVCANQKAAKTKKTSEKEKYKLLERLNLNPDNAHTKAEIQAMWNAVPTIMVRELDDELVYPYPGYWIAETEAVFDLWFQKIYIDPQPDPRLPRHPILVLDPQKLAYDLPGYKSAIFVDENGLPVMFVLRNFCKDPETVLWANRVVLDNVEVRRSIRVNEFNSSKDSTNLSQNEDAGSLVMAGWSPGLRSARKFDWVRNLLDDNPDMEVEAVRTRELSSVFACFWNMIRSFGPKEVVDDIEAFMAESKIYPMDPAIHSGGKEGIYEINTNGKKTTFSRAHMAPPQGAVARNYARHVHFENQLHAWAAFWTTFRDYTFEGGHFYNARIHPHDTPTKVGASGSPDTSNNSQSPASLSWNDPETLILLLEWRAVLLVHEMAQTVEDPDATIYQHMSKGTTETFVARRVGEMISGLRANSELKKQDVVPTNYSRVRSLSDLLSFSLLRIQNPSRIGASRDPTRRLRMAIAKNCLALLPEAIGLTDALGFSDWELDSALGVYDGRVYQALWDRAQLEPLNAKEVTDAYEADVAERMTKDGGKVG
ncbi:hypothetical protein D9757_013745 [Collybiopsis confluens]|uniref:Acyl-CoA oxidase C-terminal domain-containing protein n=1 Tax=Collybiopsis confluens TaxID=2823264 RepID=A0A8H5CUZ8_9AGAR|nr:hypothetical protein D9757_013745 [Collybiopsis confluens]